MPVNPLDASVESSRMARLRELVVLDSAPEPLFDELVRLAALTCGVPIALISLVDDERQWFKANVGLPGVNETPRDVAFCAHAIQNDALFSVADASQDDRFADNPLVTGSPHIRFYAGAPLALASGDRVGTLCVIDRTARKLTEPQIQMLQSLARLATQGLEMRRDLIRKALSVRTEFEQALTHSEARHRALIEDQAELVSLARRDGELVYVNPAYARQFQRDPAAMVGSNLFEEVDAASQDNVKRLIAEVFATGGVRTSENGMRGPDGHIRWVAWTNSLQRGVDGELLLHSVGRDFTDRKRVEDALRASQGFLYRTGRVAGVGGWEVDLATGTITWSDETRRIHEVDPAYVPVMETAIAFYVPEARQTIEAAVQRGTREGLPWDLELQMVTAQGRLIWVRTSGEVEFENAQPVRLVGAFQDISERKRLEQRLTKSERFVRQVSDGLPIRIAYVDAQRRFQFVNEAHCLRLGLPPEQIIGRTRDELKKTSADEVIEPRLKAALAGHPQHFEYDDMVDGQLRCIESRMIPDVAEDGTVRGFYSTGIDITERKATERALHELIAIFDTTPDFVVQSNHRGEVIYMNPAVRRAVGMASDTPLGGRSFREFNSPATNQCFIDTIVPAVKARGSWIGDTTILVDGGRELPVNDMVVAHRDRNGRIDRYSAVMRDISAETDARQQLLRQTATLKSVTEAIPMIVGVVGTDGLYRFANSGFERWCGSSRDKIVGRSVTDVLGRIEYERSRLWIERVQAGETVSFEKKYPGRSSYSHLAISYVPLWLDDGTVDGFVQIAQDITEHRNEEERLLQLSQRDPLTGLLNRAGFDSYMAHHAYPGAQPSLALLYIDLDHFKPVNDQHGHPVGDQVLQIFSQRLRALVRPSDAVARLGGDEFAIVLSGIRNEFSADMVADKLVAVAQLPFEVGDLQLRLGASVGVAFRANASVEVADLVARADTMLYQAKQAGRGRRAS
ncbi:PAS domain S-box protein [Rhodoferax sp. WC2427]|uniref:sensor domain-containing diguanylate cyclase n=1 Tax=Rhodoferax sp. WC2427 TaxID=3234144 RepID=UPI003466B25E